MKIRWKRGKHNLNFTRPDTWFSLGTRGAGKSSFLETVAINYMQNGASIVDLFGSRDGEGLAWLRSPYAEDKRILLVHGENVDVDSSYDTRLVEKVRLADFERYDIVISASPLYLSIEQEFVSAGYLTDILYKRLAPKRLVFAVMREASNFYYSRLKICESQVFAKAEMVYLMREARHCWLALGLDSLRFFSVDIDIRNLTDYLIIKSQGLPGLSRDLKWLYAYVNPHKIRKLKKDEFILLVNDGSLGYGIFPEVPWHKQEKEDILKAVGVKVECGEELKQGMKRGTFTTVGDKEHTEIIRLYVEENLGMVRIGEQLERSSRTISDHVHNHNDAVHRSGFCPLCKRADADYYNVMVQKGKTA